MGRVTCSSGMVMVYTTSMSLNIPPKARRLISLWWMVAVGLGLTVAVLRDLDMLPRPWR